MSDLAKANLLALRYIAEEAAAGRFYGTFSLQFKGGRLVLIRKEETFQPEALISKTSSGKTEKEAAHVGDPS